MKSFTGKVVSTKMSKTVVIERVITRAHPVYKKVVRRTKRIKAHSDIPLTLGDTVQIVSVKPMSKEKHYRVVEKVTRKV